MRQEAAAIVPSVSARPDPPEGLYTDADGRQRWWDGVAWSDERPTVGRLGDLATDNATAASAPISTGMTRQDDSGTWGAEDRRDLLDRAVTKYLEHGYRLRSNRGFRAVVGKRQALNVPLNLGLVLITGGFWLIVLAFRLTNWPVDTVVLTVDEHGVLTPEFSS